MSIVLSVLLSYSFCIIGQFYLNGTIKIRGGSSCHYVFEAPFQRQRLARAAYLCSVQNKVVRWFFVMLTHTVKKFVFPPQNGFDLALFFWPAAGLQQQVEGQLLLLSSTSLDSFSKIWSPQLRRKERKMCFGDKQRNFHSQLLSIESLLSLREMTPLCSLHLATEWQFPRVW